MPKLSGYPWPTLLIHLKRLIDVRVAGGEEQSQAERAELSAMCMMIVMDDSGEVAAAAYEAEFPFIPRSTSFFRTLKTKTTDSQAGFEYSSAFYACVCAWGRLAFDALVRQDARFAEEALSNNMLFLLEWWSSRRKPETRDMPLSGELIYFA